MRLSSSLSELPCSEKPIPLSDVHIPDEDQHMLPWVRDGTPWP